jgi:hypothetical protein
MNQKKQYITAITLKYLSDDDLIRSKHVEVTLKKWHCSTPTV